MRFYILLALASLIGSLAMAGQLVIMKPDAQHSIEKNSEAGMANLVFVGFLKCADYKEESEQLACVKRYFSKRTSAAMILRYSEAFGIATKYTELYPCSEGRKKKEKLQFKNKGYDYVLCFKSDLSGEVMREGTAFFEKAGGMPKLTKLRM